MNVTRAIARSNNCWFYQVGIETGPSAFLATARKLGYGSRSGLPLHGESSGRVPTNEYVLKKFGRPFTDGDTANYSIGQAWEATPLQVAQSMAGIANGSVLPKLQLIRQELASDDIEVADLPGVSPSLLCVYSPFDTV